MKRILSIILAFCLLLAIAPSSVFAAASDVIKNDESGIPDKALYRVILSNLGRKSGLITKKEAENLTFIDSSDIYETNIKSLKGISNFPNMRAIRIWNNKKLTLLKEIGSLDKLEGLQLYGCGIKSLSGVEKLGNLIEISVSESNITDIDAIKELTNLERIGFVRCDLTKLPNLKKLTKLEANHEVGGFEFNKLKKADFNNSLPENVLKQLTYDLWLKRQLKYQNISRTFKVTSKKGTIKKNATKIKGKTVKRSHVMLYEGKNQRGKLI